MASTKQNIWRVQVNQYIFPAPVDTKVGVLKAQLEVLEQEVASRKAYLEGLAGTKFGHPCSGCGQMLETEYDFAAHFEVRPFDIMNGHLNLGGCPIVDSKDVD